MRDDNYLGGRRGNQQSSPGFQPMIQPNFKMFSKLARQGNLVPVYETFTADLLTPVGAYLRIAHGARYSCLLESVEGGENIARYTFAGANPEEVFRARGRICTLETGSGEIHFDNDPIEQMRRLVARYHPVRVPGLPPLIGGAIGYFAYDMVRLIEKIPATGRDDLNLDDCVMMFYLGLIVFDRVRHRVWVIRNVHTDGGRLREKYDAAVREIQALRRKLEGPLPRRTHAPRGRKLRVSSNVTRPKYLAAERRPIFAPAIFFRWCRANDSRRIRMPTPSRFTARCGS
jgi:anthranilate synthase component 1